MHHEVIMTSFLFSSLRPFASHPGVSRAGNHEVTGLIPSGCVLMGDLMLGVRLARESEPIIATGSTFFPFGQHGKKMQRK